MYLVDTSVWVDYMRNTATPHVDFLHDLLGNPLATGVNDLIHLEILQGARDKARFDKLQRYFAGQRFHTLQNGRESFEAAAQLYFDCRRAGITIRSTIDCLIAQCALENDLILLHHDQDFLHIASQRPELRLHDFLR